MKNRGHVDVLLTGITAAVVFSLVSTAILWAGSPKPAAPVQRHVSSAYGNLPLSFETNEGQTDPHVQFLSRGPGHTLFLTASEAVLALRKGEAKGEGRERDATLSQPSSDPHTPAHSMVRMNFDGA